MKHQKPIEAIRKILSHFNPNFEILFDTISTDYTTFYVSQKSHIGSWEMNELYHEFKNGFSISSIQDKKDYIRFHVNN